MGFEPSALMTVQAMLCERIDALLAGMGRLRRDQLCGEIDEIRSVAGRYGLEPVRQLAAGLEVRLGEERGTSIVRPWLQMMREAAGCDRTDADAAEIFMAATFMRLGR